ncbi:MAG: hypothetical protein U9Q24_03545 [Candidatus Ratteibacteria bacterium]|nr:hypothetical protein [Candidatus Ratteibacteria bacterium]
MKLRRGYRLSGKVIGGFRRLGDIFKKFVNFLKRMTEKIYRRVVLLRLKKKLNYLQKSRLSCFQDMGERIYELKKDSSFELIDLAVINEQMDRMRKVDDKIKKVRTAVKEVKGGKIEGLYSWWSRRGSNP